MLLYALTIFVGAFLLFQVQPLIAKIILPLFGGSAAVWITCLMFFQLVLLFGYLYAHWLIKRLTGKAQRRLHLVLLGLSVLALAGFSQAARFKFARGPLGLEDPALRILGLLAVAVGLPYFLLSTTTPLLQAWYRQERREAMPYGLFALSNGASLLALVSYPVLVEPVFSTRHQVLGWSLAYAGFTALGMMIVLRRPGEASTTETQTTQLDAAGASSPLTAPRWSLQLLWLSLAACASTLLLAVTHHLTQNVAAVPFLWILPLSMYLLSFILCFQGRSWYRRDLFLRFLAVGLGGMAYALAPPSVNSSLFLLIPLYSLGLFLCCMVCHGELEALKPHPAYLTSFYLMVSLGGAAGGIFVGFVAPHVFRSFLELPIGMAGLAALVLVLLYRDLVRVQGRRWRPSWLILVALAGALVVGLAYRIWEETEDVRVIVRNFYGVLRVVDLDPIPRDRVLADTPVLEPAKRKLINGSIDHGVQFLAPDRRRLPTTYYGPRSGAGLALGVCGRHGNLRVGVIGLGAGTLAVYGRPGDHYTFYELNPLVIQLANTEFTFLKDSKARVDVVTGDGRLSLEREPFQAFDVLAVDAFSGDSIPVHLLTREAFALYFRQLKSSGVLAVHITNRYLDLRSVVLRAAEVLGKRASLVESGKDEENQVFRATWVLVSGSREFFDDPDIRQAGSLLQGKTSLRLWTDDFSNLFSVLKR